MKTLRLAAPLILAASLALGACTALDAQNPGGAWSPVNAVAMDGQDRVLLKGADVVAYFTEGRYRPGDARFTSTHEGVTLRFATAEHKALFDAAPAKYLPQFGGYCANGIAYGIPWGGDADSWRIEDGKLYIFGGAGSKAAHELDLAGNTALAHRYWAEEIQGRNSFWQRGKRLVFRVPHYKTGEELAKLVAEAQARAAK